MPTGNIRQGVNTLGVGRRLLGVAEADRLLQGLPFLSRILYVDDGLTQIRVLATNDNNARIEIHSEVPIEEEIKPDSYRRERLLHCRIEVTLVDEISEYADDPAFVMFHKLPVSKFVIPLHFTYNVDMKQTVLVPREMLPQETPLEDAVPIIEGFTGFILVDAVVDNTGTRICPIELTERLIPEDETDINKLGYLDKFPGEKNKEEFTVDGYTYHVLTDESGEHFSLLKDTYFREPLEKYDLQVSEFNPNVVSGALEVSPLNTVPVHAQIEMINALETVRLLWVESEEYPGAYEPNGWWTGDYNTPVATKNDEDIADLVETAISLATPFSYVVSDFGHIEGLGLASVKQDTTHNATRYTEDGLSEVLFLSAPSYAIIPYYFESKKMDQVALDHGALGPDEWGHDPSDFYGLYPTRSLVGTSRMGLQGCIDLNADCSDWYTLARMTTKNDWLQMPFRGDMWAPDLSDYFTWGELSDKYFPGFGEWEPGGLYSAVFNRVVLCVRAFYANTPDATVKSMDRKQYNIHWGGDYAGSPLNFSGLRLPRLADYYDPSLDNIDIFNADNRCSYKMSTFDTVEGEMSPPLTTEYLPTFTTVKGDLVHVALLSSIYAESNKDEIQEEDSYVSDRLGDIPGGQGAVVTKRPFFKAQEGVWDYVNVYGAGVVVTTISEVPKGLVFLGDLDASRNALPSLTSDISERMFSVNGVYGLDEETGENKTDCEPEMIKAIYAELEYLIAADTPTSTVGEFLKENAPDRGVRCFPICGVKLEVNLYDKYLDSAGKTVYPFGR